MSKHNWETKAEQLGDIAELNCIAELRKHGRVSIPYGQSAPYDCIFEDETGKIFKCQIKHGHLVQNINTKSIQFRTVNRNGTPYRKNDVDMFCVYNSELKEFWYVPIDCVWTSTKQTINLTTTSRSQGLPASICTLKAAIKNVEYGKVLSSTLDKCAKNF